MDDRELSQRLEKIEEILLVIYDHIIGERAESQDEIGDNTNEIEYTSFFQTDSKSSLDNKKKIGVKKKDNE
jgi:hypothetical protein